MKFLILRQLQHSELGMFHAYRRSGREGSRQRAINFDGEVIDRVFPVAADTDRIALSLRYDTDNGPRTRDHFLKRQGKNWRLEGNCPDDQLYDFVQLDCLFAMQVDAGIQPASGAWTVFPKDDPTALAILADGATSGLARAGMVGLELDEAPRIYKLLTQARPDLFSASSPQDLDMTDTTSPTETIDKPSGRRLPPGSKRLPTMLSASGHNLVSAVADIIDNAISADATEIQITFDPPNSGNGRWMAIRDNGRGMSPEQLEEAIRVGGEADYDGRSLGKYGFGLKGASWSQARDFKVVTRQKGGDIHHLGWDQDNMADWQVDEEPLEDWETEAADPGEHGTVVLWKNMKAPTMAPSIKGVPPHVAEIQELNRHLGLVFHRFLDGEAKGRAPLKIWINDIPVESNGPASHPLSERHDLKTLKVEHEGGTAEVKVQPIVLPAEDELRKHHGDGWQAAADRIGYWGRRNDTQGLFLYRNDRLIRWGGWHDLWATNDEKTKLARVLVDFDPALDEAFQINISKQTVRLPGYLQSRIKPLADTVRKASQAKYRKPRPTSPPPRTSPLLGEATSGPGAPSGLGEPVTPGAPTPPSQPPITVRKVTTGKFAWKITTDLKGDRSLQIGDVSPALVELAGVLGSSDVGAEALAAFLEDLDRLDVQQALIDDATEA
ncbi:ATP-binding protein [Mesorhizobium sp. B261B1A]|uniref:ATP-binding protein n=1 Tax=Mesorhizobium sp. B261B1A TaxID=2876671 RepID=UPI001CD0B8A7|nr:ATP-binding protein [Mesorhizobium sp. B261B1A]MCA0058031.1 ATP-binding protein [Mesorhizobium sp. B261B1A]